MKALELKNGGITWFTQLPCIPLLGGILLGLTFCSVAGRAVSQRPMFKDFVRFYLPIQPNTLFYPTASQLVTQVEKTVPKDKILVIIGGASWFRGEGQPEKQLWSLELQRLLGERYAVVNYAIDSASPPSFANTAFQVLSRSYPRIIFVSSHQPKRLPPPDGSPMYRYIFWDAYYKGLLPLTPDRAKILEELAATEKKDPLQAEVHYGAWLDQFTYSTDLWGYVAYKYFSTVWCDTLGNASFQARESFKDERNQPGDVDRIRLQNLANAQYKKISEADNKSLFSDLFEKDAQGHWQPVAGVWERNFASCQQAFPDEFKSKCLLVMVKRNPHYMETLTVEELLRDTMAYQKGVDDLIELGYNSIMIGDGYTSEDYIDFCHYMASGGKKIAASVAPAVEAVARRNGYIP